MSNFDSVDPFDNGHPWQDVPSNPARPRSSNNNNDIYSTAGSSSAAAADSQDLASFNIPSTAAAVAAATATATAPSAPGPHAPAEPAISSSQYSSTPSPVPPKQKQTHVAAYEDEPPSYEAAIVRDIPQIHDNYDHLRGPPGQRGVDIKTRIPLDSTPASAYRSSSAGASGSAAGGSRNGAGQSYGATIQQQRPSFANIAQPSAPALLQGQASEGRADDEAHARDVDRLLGPSNNSTHPHLQHAHPGRHGQDPSDMDDEEPDSHWSVVGDGKAWMALTYILVILLPWALFCFIWTLATLITAAVSMIIPPLGYLIVIPVVTSWRALARVDLVVSRALVARSVRERYPHLTAPVFVMPPESASWNTHSTRHRRRRQTKNLWHRGAKHLKATINNKHTVKSMFYLMIWKLFYALPIFLVIIIFAALTVPFMICLLPTLLILSRALINWQFRWAVVWLTEKPQPISLP